MLSETEKAWMAGFVDGEGYITIRKLSPGHRYSPLFVPTIAISNIVKPILNFFASTYGGQISDNGNSKRNPRWSPSFVWFCPIPEIKRFLKDLQPYLKLKRKEAAILLHFMETRKKRLGGFGRVYASELEKRERFWREICEIKFSHSGKPTKWS